MTQMDYNKRRGYFNFGMGTRMNINGDLGYHILSTEKDQLNLWYSHRSTNGKPKDYDVKAKINDNLGGINVQARFREDDIAVSERSTATPHSIIMGRHCLILHPVMPLRRICYREIAKPTK